MPLHVPGLARKLQYLYQRHPSIHNHESLARYLGIAPNNISTWINGSDVRAPEMVPNRHISPLTRLFQLGPQLLETTSIEEFKAELLASSLTTTSPWLELQSKARVFDGIQLVRREQHEFTPPVRGLVADDEEPLEQFFIGERLYIQIEITRAWPRAKDATQSYALLLSVDPVATTCLCPSALAPEARISQSRFTVPQAAPDRQLKVAGPAGTQSLYLLLTAWQFLPDQYHALMEQVTQPLLDAVALEVQSKPAGEWQVWRKDYQVV